MKAEIKIPTVGESINEATIAQWNKKSGDYVRRDEVLLSLETDKANVDVVAEHEGRLEIKEQAGAVLPIGTVIGHIDTNAQAEAGGSLSQTPPPPSEERTATKILVPSAPPSAFARGANAENGEAFEVKVPAVGESITEATIASWQKKNGERVERDQVLLSLETDKATVDVVAEQSGALEIIAEAGAVVKIGSVIARIRGGAAKAAVSPALTSAPEARSIPAEPAPALMTSGSEPALSPSVRRVVAEHNLDPSKIAGSGRGGRIMKEDVENFAKTHPSEPVFGTGAVAAAQPTFSRSIVSTPAAPTVSKPQAPANPQLAERRQKMTTIRKRIAERLVMAQSTAAILTTFNEINMGAAVALRAKYKDAFKEKYGVGLGYLGLFTKACVEALRSYPEVNAFIDGDEIVYHDTYSIGIAVSGPKGLMVPVLHHAENLSVADVELKIRAYAEKAKAGKISIEDLSGGTFTISNGGTFGSMMSTPILNPPQSGILGMHKIEDRPIAVNGKVEIHPMMYIALSYDHRIIDGEGAVKFLVKVKDSLEDPSRLLLEI